MTTITNNTTFNVTEQEAEVIETVTIPIIATAATAPDGTGRLVHPTLGTYDYDLAPTHWTNVDQDIVIKPVWKSTQTLTGNSFTLWNGYADDTVVTETWKPTGRAKASMRNSQMRMLLDMYQAPPNPQDDLFVEWYPNYTNASGYQVAILSFAVAGKGVTLDFVSRAGLIQGSVNLKMQIVGKL